MKTTIRSFWVGFLSRWSKALLVSSVAALLIVAGCNDSLDKSPRPFPNDPAAFTGQITMVVSEPRTKGFVNFTYEYDLSAGTARLQDRRESRDRAEVPLDRFATGYVGCYGSPKLKSPDGKFTAHCEGPMSGTPRDRQHDFIVVDDKLGNKIFRQGVDAMFRIIGYAWSPDSRSIAVAESASEGLIWHPLPLDLLAALRGRPTKVCSFYLMPYRIDGTAALGALGVARDGSRDGVGIIVGWK